MTDPSARLASAEPASEPVNVGDPALRKTRLLSRECSTCIFTAGNPMRLEPGRLKQLITDAHGDGKGYIVCHSTLPYTGSPIPPAICRGFANATAPGRCSSSPGSGASSTWTHPSPRNTGSPSA